jgi:hypothetical protein
MKILIIIILLIFSFSIHAADERWINFDWDPIENATSYEVELLQEVQGNVFSLGIFKTDIPEWNKAVNSGKYFVKIRALDKRMVPGEWSEKQAIIIKGKPPELEFPKYEDSLEVEQTDGFIQNFSWRPALGAQFYKIQIFNNQQKLIYSEILTTTTYSYRLSNPGQYFWNVASLTSKDEEPEENLKKSPFKIIYGKLISPDISIKTTKNVLIFNWSHIKQSPEFYIDIYKQNEDGTFINNLTYKQKETQLSLPKSQFQKGTYRFAVIAKKEGYIDSGEAEVIYEYDLEDIKVVAEKSGEDLYNDKRLHGIFSLEAYFAVPSLSYTFKNYEEDTIGSQALSGSSVDLTLRKNKPLAFISFTDLFFISNLKLMSLSDTYASAIFGTVSFSLEKKFNYKRFSFFPNVGIFAEKTPLFIISRLNTNSATTKDSMTIGPRLSLKTVFELTSYVSLTVSQNILLHKSQLSGLAGNTFQSNIETEFNFGAKYIFKPTLDLVFKYSINNYSLTSIAKTGSGSHAQAGDVNDLKISGSIISGGVIWYF